jgi:hypothetical protein
MERKQKYLIWRNGQLVHTLKNGSRIALLKTPNANQRARFVLDVMTARKTDKWSELEHRGGQEDDYRVSLSDHE